MQTHGERSRHLWRDLLYGMIGGVVGTVALERVTDFLYARENEATRQIEERLRQEAPTEVAARRFYRALTGTEPTEPVKSRLASAIHWGYGIAWGGLYGVAHDRVPLLARAAGLPFGLLFFLIGDEWVTTAFRLTPPPRAFPIQAHLRGLAGHLAFAAAADGVYHGLRRLAGGRQR